MQSAGGADWLTGGLIPLCAEGGVEDLAGGNDPKFVIKNHKRLADGLYNAIGISPRRFEFVRNPQLRPILEEAFVESGRALASADFTRSLMTSCGILEAIITDALEDAWRSASLSPRSSGQAGERARVDVAPGDPIADWSFERRIAVAEKTGLIRGGCARLPPSARAYRDIADVDRAPGSAMTAISERDAKIARQVLHVVMRDLDPGR
jgi:hypothetical protein